MLEKKIKKFLANIVCIFISEKEKREETRKRIVNKVIDSNKLEKYIKVRGGRPYRTMGFYKS